MEYYFKLQFRMLKRQMADFGIHPIVGFRNAFPLIFFAWFLAIISVSSDNFNLGVFDILPYLFNPERNL